MTDYFEKAEEAMLHAENSTYRAGTEHWLRMAEVWARLALARATETKEK